MSRSAAIKQLMRELDELQSGYVRGLPSDQRTAVEIYQGMGPEINHHLRMRRKLRDAEGRRALDKNAEVLESEFEDMGATPGLGLDELVDALDETIEDAPRSPEMLELYRTIRGLGIGPRRGRQDAYLSTSISPYAAMNAGSSGDLGADEFRDYYTLMEMTAQPNEPMLWVGKEFDPSFRTEMEVLLPRRRKLENLGHYDTPRDLMDAFKSRSEHSRGDSLNDLVERYLITKKRGGLVDGHA